MAAAIHHQRRSAIAAPTSIHPPRVPTKCVNRVPGRLCARTYTGQNSAKVIEDPSQSTFAQEPIINLSKWRNFLGGSIRTDLEVLGALPRHTTKRRPH